MGNGNGRNHLYPPLLLLIFQSLLFYYIILLNGVTLFANSKTLTIPKAPKNSITTILVFGDSTVDPGNNNFVRTIFKGNFAPYGRDFVNSTPTGRFTNGRLAADFVASYIGVKEYVPPYLDPTLSFEELLTGVSFASAGTGFDPLTPRISNVIGLPQQLEYFKEYKKRLEDVIGKKNCQILIEKALVIVSAATNDFVFNYYTLPIRRSTYSISDYQQFILQKEKQFIQDLFELGARRILVSGLGPMGCLPLVISLSSNISLMGRNCDDNISSIAKEYNLMLRYVLSLMQNQLAGRGARFYFSDAYNIMFDMINGSGRSAFDNVNTGCCGTGYLEAAFLCNPRSYVCPDPSKYVFWDSIHPTEQAYYNIFIAMRSSLDSVIIDW